MQILQYCARRSLLDFWAAIAPNELPPETLKDLQVRAGLQPNRSGRRPPLGAEGFDHPGRRGIASPPQPSAYAEGGRPGGECTRRLQQWLMRMLFNHYGESVNSTDVWPYDGYVCSAEGTSNGHSNLGGAKSVNIDIQQAHWASDWWIAPTNPWPWGAVATTRTCVAA